MRKGVRARLGLTLAVAGCLSCASLSPSQKQVASALGCGAAGAAAGGAIGNAVGETTGLVIGAVAGGVAGGYTCYRIAKALTREEAEDLVHTRNETVATDPDNETVREWENDDGSKTASVVAEPARPFEEAREYEDTTLNPGAAEEIPENAKCRRVGTTLHTPDHRVSDSGLYCVVGDEVVRVGTVASADEEGEETGRI